MGGFRPVTGRPPHSGRSPRRPRLAGALRGARRRAGRVHDPNAAGVHAAVIGLHDYLDAQRQRRFVWGESDCVQFGLGWVRARTGRPLAAFEPYCSRADAVALLRRHGGLGAVVERWMADCGFKPTDAPDDGDVGLAPVEPVPEWGGEAVAVVIRCGPWWMSREPRGIGGKSLGRIPAWRIL